MRVYVAGINGMVGSAVANQIRTRGHTVLGKSSTSLDFTRRDDVFHEFIKMKPQALIIAAAKVGGIRANSNFPVDFLSTNLQIQTNLLDAAHEADIKKLVFMGSSCVYPKFADQPIQESALLRGELEPTNEAYAIAKIAGLKLVEAYRRQYGHTWISVMPTNLYGPRDNFSLETAHVLPAMIHRFHLAKAKLDETVEIWGDGTPLREFLHVDDLARACITILDKYDDSAPINVGTGREISIEELARLVSRIVGYKGKIVFNSDLPNGTPRKFLNSERMLNLGWRPQIDLEEGIATTYNWFLTRNASEEIT